MVAKYKAQHPEMDEMTIISKLVAYSSDQVSNQTAQISLGCFKNFSWLHSCQNKFFVKIVLPSAHILFSKLISYIGCLLRTRTTLH